MTDTEILDYLEKASVIAHMPHDVVIGRCQFTLGRKNEKRTFREILLQSIEADKLVTVARVTRAIENS